MLCLANPRDKDSTLIATKSGAKHPKDGTDWRWWHASVPKKLKELHFDGFVVAIISNQGGISLKTDAKTPSGQKRRFTDFKQKAASVFNQLEIPISVYAATEQDIYRKPRTGMWNTLLEDLALRHGNVDLPNCIFVGDAAGRPQEGARKADFSSSDRDFAANLNLPYQTPEEFFLGEQAKPYERAFDPVRYVEPIPNRSIDASPILFSKKHDLDLVIFVGSPGSGKSTFYKRHLAALGYKRVNQDILKKRDRCVEVTREHLERKEPVVVDNTNRDIATRKVWVDLANEFKIPIRCVQFTADPALCKHNDVVRALNITHNPENRTMLPGNAFPMYKNAFQMPDTKEGFEDITKVDFIFEGTEDERLVWTKYWT